MNGDDRKAGGQDLIGDISPQGPNLEWTGEHSTSIADAKTLQPGGLNTCRRSEPQDRKFAYAADLFETPGRLHEALAFRRELFRIERRIRDLSDEERLRERKEKTVPPLTQFKDWLDRAAHIVRPNYTLSITINYGLNHLEALTNVTRTGYLAASSDFAERLMRLVAGGRKALFVCRLRTRWACGGDLLFIGGALQGIQGQSLFVRDLYLSNPRN